MKLRYVAYEIREQRFGAAGGGGEPPGAQVRRGWLDPLRDAACGKSRDPHVCLYERGGASGDLADGVCSLLVPFAPQAVEVGREFGHDAALEANLE